MKNSFVTFMIAAALILSAVAVREKARAQTASAQAADSMGGTMAGPAVANANDPAGFLVYVTEMPPGYRDWRLISVAHEEGNLHSFAAVLGNDVANKAYREGTLPFPDGTIIAALHYHHVPSTENNKVFGREQSFVAGDPSNVQFMIKDAKAYAATGGWGFGHFQNAKPLTDKAKLQGCFDCHAQNKERDMVFTRYSP